MLHKARRYAVRTVVVGCGAVRCGQVCCLQFLCNEHVSSIFTSSSICALKSCLPKHHVILFALPTTSRSFDVGRTLSRQHDLLIQNGCGIACFSKTSPLPISLQCNATFISCITTNSKDAIRLAQSFVLLLFPIHAIACAGLPYRLV